MFYREGSLGMLSRNVSMKMKYTNSKQDVRESKTNVHSDTLQAKYYIAFNNTADKYRKVNRLI